MFVNKSMKVVADDESGIVVRVVVVESACAVVTSCADVVSLSRCWTNQVAFEISGGLKQPENEKKLYIYNF